MREQITSSLDAEEEDVFEIPGLLDLQDLWDIVRVPGHSELRDRPWTPVTQARLQPDEGEESDVLAAMRKGDILLHHPYDSFATSVERFVEQAVADPNVLAIKQTVYRTSGDSPLVPALIRAAERGKQAVCVVEVKARFDERANIHWARALEQAGVHVVHGLPALKTHAKCLLVVRREGDGVRHYVHVGTGNYHPTTARLYTDFGLLTCDEEIGADVADMFNFLTGFARPKDYRRVLVAPAHLRDGILGEIERTIAAHREGRSAAHPHEDELAGGPRVHRRAVPRLAGGRAGRAQRARHLLPAARGPRRVGEHHRQLGRRALPRALAHLRLRARRRLQGLHRLGRPDAAQPRHAGRAADPGRRAGAAGRADRHAGPLPGRRHELAGSSARTGSWTRRVPGEPPRNAQRELMERHAARAAEAQAT